VLNDGDINTWIQTGGDTSNYFYSYFDSTQIPDGAVISSVVVSGECSNGSGGSTSFSCTLGSTVAVGSLTSEASYSFALSRPGGGTWTKADVAAMYVLCQVNADGNGNPVRAKSQWLTVTYVLSGAYFVTIY
jgi:hypothetical protein